MSFLYRFSVGAALVYLGATILPFAAKAQVDTCTAIEGAFDFQVIPQDGFEIQWSMDTSADTITFQVYNSEQSWTSIGFSADDMMVPSDAVIGLPDNNTVLEYNLTLRDISGVISLDDQEITDYSVIQDSNGTTLNFTRPLTPSSADKEIISSTPGDEHWIIWAYGTSNELDYHSNNRGSLLLDLFCGQTANVSTPGPTTLLAMVPSMSPTSETPSPGLTMSLAPSLTSAPTAMTAESQAPSEVSTMAPSEVSAPSPSEVSAPTPSGVSTPSSTSGPTVMPSTTPSPEESMAFRVEGSGLWMTATTALAALLVTSLIGLSP